MAAQSDTSEDTRKWEIPAEVKSPIEINRYQILQASNPTVFVPTQAATLPHAEDYPAPDLDLVVGEVTLHVHADTLRMGSPYFMRLLNPKGGYADSGVSKPCIVDHPLPAVVQCVMYMYTAHFDLLKLSKSPHAALEVVDVAKACEFFMLAGALETFCVPALRKYLSKDNVQDVLEACEAYGPLREVCVLFLATSRCPFSRPPKWSADTTAEIELALKAAHRASQLLLDGLLSGSTYNKTVQDVCKPLSDNLARGGGITIGPYYSYVYCSPTVDGFRNRMARANAGEPPSLHPEG